MHKQGKAGQQSEAQEIVGRIVQADEKCKYWCDAQGTATIDAKTNDAIPSVLRMQNIDLEPVAVDSDIDAIEGIQHRC